MHCVCYTVAICMVAMVTVTLSVVLPISEVVMRDGLLCH